MSFTQIYQEISRDELVNEALQFKQEGWELVQISATFKEHRYDLLYSFERHYHMIHLRISLDDGEWVESISSVYPFAYLYENEMRDLFDIEVNNMNVDFGGYLYQTAIKTPFHVKAEDEEAKN